MESAPWLSVCFRLSGKSFALFSTRRTTDFPYLISANLDILCDSVDIITVILVIYCTLDNLRLQNVLVNSVVLLQESFSINLTYF